MRLDEIRNQLSRYCDFPNDCSYLTACDGSSQRYPAREMAFIRCGHNGTNWYRAPYIVRKSLYLRQREKELEAVTSAILGAFANISELEDFCIEHAEDLRADGQYNLYLSSADLCNYWIRVNTTRRNYPLYIHAIVKPKFYRKDI